MSTHTDSVRTKNVILSLRYTNSDPCQRLSTGGGDNHIFLLSTMTVVFDGDEISVNTFLSDDLAPTLPQPSAGPVTPIRSHLAPNGTRRTREEVKNM